MSIADLNTLADVAAVAGAVGLVSGFGGKYFFLVPVVEYASPALGTWGASAWAFPSFETSQGLYADTWATLWAMSGISNSHFPAPDLSGNMEHWVQKYVPASGFECHNCDYVKALNKANSAYGAKWGPFGRAGTLMLAALMLGGMAVRSGSGLYSVL